MIDKVVLATTPRSIWYLGIWRIAMCGGRGGNVNETLKV